jgi:hypothetical protein
MQAERDKCNEAAEHINMLKVQFNANAAALAKLERQTASLPFQNFLDNRGDSIT